MHWLTCCLTRDRQRWSSACGQHSLSAPHCYTAGGNSTQAQQLDLQQWHQLIAASCASQNSFALVSGFAALHICRPPQISRPPRLRKENNAKGLTLSVVQSIVVLPTAGRCMQCCKRRDHQRAHAAAFEPALPSLRKVVVSSLEHASQNHNPLWLVRFYT